MVQGKSSKLVKEGVSEGSAQGRLDEGGLDIEPERRVSVGFQCSLSFADAESKPLDETQVLHGTGQTRVAIVGLARLAKIGRIYATERSTRTDDLDSVVKPVDSYGCVGTLVRAVHHGIS